MDIPANILEKFKCSRCDEYLSTRPVMITMNGENVCANCVQEDQKAVRNQIYEDMAALFLFPCYYKNDGCTFKLPFGDIQDHKLSCDYRRYSCPMTALNNCTWFEKYNEMYKHFEESHSESIMAHPCELKIDLGRNYENYFLVSVYKLLFLLQVKCNVAAGKLWYCVRFIGNPNFAKQFIFHLNINNEHGDVKKKRCVETIETILLSQNKVLEIDINSLINILSLKQENDIFGLLSIKFSNEVCLKCPNNNVNIWGQLEINGYLCIKCARNGRCKYAKNGCNYQDAIFNLAKHEHVFCTFAPKYCIINYYCKQLEISETTNYEHLMKKHHYKGEIIYNKSVILECEINGRYAGQVIKFNSITFIRDFCYSNFVLDFKVITDMPKSETQNYKCKLIAKNVKTKYCIEKDLLINLDSVDFDWSVKIQDPNKQLVYRKEYSTEFFIEKIF